MNPFKYNHVNTIVYIHMNHDPLIQCFIRRIARENEMPLPRYFTLKLYSIIRSKTIIQTLFHHGICLSYHRVQMLINELNVIANELYSRSGDNVLPSAIRLGLFTVNIDDNIDQNSRSMTATRHFHGASRTILQYPSAERPGTTRYTKKYEELTTEERKTYSSPAVQIFHTVGSGLTFPKRMHSPIQLVNYDESWEMTLDKCFSEESVAEIEWMSAVANVIKLGNHPASGVDVSTSSWTAYHAQKNRDSSSMPSTIIVSLPVTDHVVSDINFQYQNLNIARRYTIYVNPGQTTVACSDEPLYACKKMLLWAFPNEFKKSGMHKGARYMTYTPDILPFMGPLHIEKAILQCHGNLVKGTGLDDLLAAAGLKSIGLKTAMVDVNDIKKSRYSCQVMTPVLYSLLQDAYTEATNCPSNEIDKIKEWAKDQTSTSSNILLRNIGTFDKHPFVCQIFERSQPRSFRRYS